MKQLKLKAFALGATEVLTREQLKKVTGGYEGDPGLVLCMSCDPHVARDCESVGKGSCTWYDGSCNKYCCSGWQQC